MIQRLSLLLFIVAAIPAALLIGCSDDAGNPVNPGNGDGYCWVHYNGDSTKIEFDGLPSFSADGEDAIQLDAFIDTLLIPMFVDKAGSRHDARALYAYQIVGEDGFSASVNRGYPNNIWGELKLGHVMKASRQVVFPDEKIDLEGAYNVKKARHIYIYRKVDVRIADSTAFVELRAVTPVTVTNADDLQEQAVQLKDIVAVLLPSTEGFMYNIKAVDGFGPSSAMTWQQFQTGYWLLTSQSTMFTDTTLVGGRYKIKALQSISVE